MGELLKNILDLFGIGKMEFITAIAFLLFVLPEIFRKKKKEYEYPEIPDDVIEEHHKKAKTFKEKKYPEYNPTMTVEYDDLTKSFPTTSMLDGGDTNAWQGNLTSATVYNGYIFSEVLQPPRAYRPINGKTRQSVQWYNRRPVR